MDISKPIHTLKDLYQLKQVSNPRLANFNIYNHYEERKIVDSFDVRLGNDRVLICIAELVSSIGYTRMSSSIPKYDKSLYAFGYLKSKKNLGVTIIRPETITDKLLDVFYKLDVDFKEHKEFSNKYFVSTNNRELFLANLNFEMLDCIKITNDLILEIQNTQLLFRIGLIPLETENLLKLVKIGLCISKVINK